MSLGWNLEYSLIATEYLAGGLEREFDWENWVLRHLDKFDVQDLIKNPMFYRVLLGLYTKNNIDSELWLRILYPVREKIGSLVHSEKSIDGDKFFKMYPSLYVAAKSPWLNYSPLELLVHECIGIRQRTYKQTSGIYEVRDGNYRRVR